MTGPSNMDLLQALDRIAAAVKARADLVDLLRDHVVDWGHCSSPIDCDCSDARARRFLADELADPEFMDGVT